MREAYDILIAGGGLVGSALAVALSQTRWRVGVLEARPFEPGGEPGYDDRVSALSYTSRRILSGLGLWSTLAADACPIRHIHISDRGRFGFARLDHREEGVEALGYVLANRRLGQVLQQAVAARPGLDVIAPARLRALAVEGEHVSVTVDTGGETVGLRARLLVGADGTASTVRDHVGIQTRQSDYGQSALIANVTPERDHGNRAYERFTASGPLALLPMCDRRCALVWSHRREDLAATERLDDAAFLRALQAAFGYRLGRFLRVGRRSSYPLSLVRARRDWRERVALVGNAAHTLHPVAGQGLNLALRDVAVLAELVAATPAGGDPGRPALLRAYEQWRARDLRDVVRYTHGLVSLFGSERAPLAFARDAGLLAMDTLAPIRHAVARQGMGLRARLPRLGRGLSLTGGEDGRPL